MLCTVDAHLQCKKLAIRLAVGHLYLVTAEIWGNIYKYCEHGCTLKSGRNDNYTCTVVVFCKQDKNVNFFS